jgi:anti-sigma B factor antagonist
MEPPFTTALVGDPPNVCLALRGELDIDGTTTLESGLAALFDSGPVLPVLDLSGLTFLGSAGLGALLRAQRSNPDLVLRGVRPAQRRVFEIAGVLAVLRLEADLAIN